MRTATDQDQDRRLVEAHQAGDEGAFAELFALHYPRLVRFCRRRLAGDEQAAEDIAQAAFLRAFVAVDGLTGDRRFYAWVRVIAGRLILHHFRTSQRRAAAYRRAGVVAPRVQDGPETALVDRLTDALADRQAVAALARVSPRHRQVLQLREREGLSYAEISVRMQISEAAVPALLHRARAALRREFQAITSREPLAALVALGGAAAGALRRSRDRWARWASAVPDASALSVPAAVSLFSLGALLGIGVGGQVGQSLGLTSPSHSTASDAISMAGQLGAASTPGSGGGVGTRPVGGQHTRLGRLDALRNAGSFRDGVASISNGEAAYRDRDRARNMPLYFEHGPIYWGLDPNQAQREVQDLTDG